MGENIVARHLLKKNHIILGRNLKYRCGELDIVSFREGIIHFVEVKTACVIRETQVLSVLPEENLHLERLRD